MRYLIATSRVLFPMDTGGKTRSVNLIAGLSKNNDTTVVCYRSSQDTEAAVDRMCGICTRLDMVPWEEVVTGSPRFYANALLGLLSRRPYAVSKYTSAAMAARLKDLLAEHRYDVFLCDSALMADNMPRDLALPSVVFQHNVEARIREQQYLKATNLVKKALFYWEWRRSRAFEGDACRRFDHCIMVSENDCATTTRDYGVVSTSAIPLAVDTDYFRPEQADQAGEKLDLVFTGSMDWMPNEDGIVFFVKEILPLICARRPCRLWAVGRNPTANIRRLAVENKNVEVTGRVDDIRPYLARAVVYVVPLRIGGGTRIKIFEAMASGKPVVSTRLGAEGLLLEHNRHVLLADKPAEFADACLRLLESPELRQRIGMEGRRLVVEQYGWDAAVRVMAAACEKTVQQYRTRCAAPRREGGAT